MPGHFTADGNAANSGATQADVWRAYFMPPATGEWSYSISFRQGEDLAVNTNASAGRALERFDGESGRFNVGASRASGDDMRAKGLLEHRDGERYLRHAGDNSIYISGGMDSPENIFGYDEFDNTRKFSNVRSCKGILHFFEPHARD